MLYDSFLQAQILSEEVAVAKGRMYAYEDLMTALEGRGLLDRGAEKLPGTEEIAERRRANRGLERPELALLLAYAKQALALDLLDSDFCEDPWLERDLRDYFPDRVVERFGHLLRGAPAAPRADRDDQRQRGRELARPDVRLPAQRRARRRARRDRARVPDRARRDGRRARAGTPSSSCRAGRTAAS